MTFNETVRVRKQITDCIKQHREDLDFQYGKNICKPSGIFWRESAADRK